MAEVCDAASALCAEGELSLERLSGEVERVLAAEEARRAAVERLRVAEPSGWERQAEYLQERSGWTALLDLMGWLVGERVDAALHRALSDPDLRLKAFAVAALVRRGSEVEPRHLAQIENDPDLRAWLQSRLSGPGRQVGPSASNDP
ncbi:MAG: hypothetical protein QM765_47645 [Myxococcales bacterium]